uniref:Uncharacterized protein n=1 Tax=Spongospora subterranea TaxID=70186 RepID=A0A0H5RHK2_9EUKA|eukprot:CRZ08149.1 hypothetical protein [Spongospora subterranea]
MVFRKHRHFMTMLTENHGGNDILNDPKAEIPMMWRCNGHNTRRSFRVKTASALLRVETVCPSLTSLANIDRRILFGDVEYSLFAVIMFNGFHFTGLILPQGGGLYYDGMKRPCLRWVNISTFIFPSGYRVAHSLYKRVNLDCMDTGSTDGTSSSSSHQISKLVKKTTERLTKKPSLKKPPIGLSVHTVSMRGKKPQCKSCSDYIERGESRLVSRQVTNAERGWCSIKSYHVLHQCLQAAIDERELTLNSLEVLLKDDLLNSCVLQEF